MIVKKHVPEPVPPTTYDLLGLTEEHVHILLSVLAKTRPSHFDGDSYEIFRPLSDAIGGIQNMKYDSYVTGQPARKIDG